MGRDKALLRWHGKSLLQHIKQTARQSRWPVRVIRHDIVPRCGPLGGVFTALRTTRFDIVLFLACDMPFISPELINEFIGLSRPAFAYGAEGAGFPFLLPKRALSSVEEQIAARRYSLQCLAESCRAQKLGAKDMGELFNVNTPEDWKIARKTQSKLVIPSKKGKVGGC
jgi:molybdopterin-guanine dinucleotide biosynthesis protein A